VGERCDPRANETALRSGPCRASASSLLPPARATRLGHRPLRVTSRSCLERRTTARLGIIPRMSTDPRSGEALGVAGNPSTELNSSGCRGAGTRTPDPLVPRLNFSRVRKLELPGIAWTWLDLVGHSADFPSSMRGRARQSSQHLPGRLTRGQSSARKAAGESTEGETAVRVVRSWSRLKCEAPLLRTPRPLASVAAPREAPPLRDAYMIPTAIIARSSAESTSGSVRTSMSAGTPALAARSSAGRRSARCSTRSPRQPRDSARRS